MRYKGYHTTDEAIYDCFCRGLIGYPVHHSRVKDANWEGIAYRLSSGEYIVPGGIVGRDSFTPFNIVDFTETGIRINNQSQYPHKDEKLRQQRESNLCLEKIDLEYKYT